MSKEELEKLKAEIKEEILADMKKKPEKKKLWKEFVEEIRPDLDKKGYYSGQFFNSTNYIVRNILGIHNIQNITEEQMEQVRPIYMQIIEWLPQKTPIKRGASGYVLNGDEVI